MDREASSRLAQREPEIGFDVSHNQSNIPVDEKSRHNLINQGAVQQDGVSVIELPKVETERRLAPEDKSEPLSENSLNLRDVTIRGNWTRRAIFVEIEQQVSDQI